MVRGCTRFTNAILTAVFSDKGMHLPSTLFTFDGRFRRDRGGSAVHDLQVKRLDEVLSQIELERRL